MKYATFRYDTIEVKNGLYIGQVVITATVEWTFIETHW